LVSVDSLIIGKEERMRSGHSRFGLSACHRVTVISFLSLLSLAPLGGCRLYDLPETGPAEESVFAAAEQVILSHYPMATATRRSNAVLALTPVRMDGGYPSRTQITVHVAQNYTGAWEPRVRVTRHVDVAEPPLDANPDSDAPGNAHPVVRTHWKPLVHLDYEAERLRDEILAALSPSAATRA
jgi:hypothetical protein